MGCSMDPADGFIWYWPYSMADTFHIECRIVTAVPGEFGITCPGIGAIRLPRDFIVFKALGFI